MVDQPILVNREVSTSQDDTSRDWEWGLLPTTTSLLEVLTAREALATISNHTIVVDGVMVPSLMTVQGWRLSFLRSTSCMVQGTTNLARRTRWRPRIGFEEEMARCLSL